MPNNNDTEKKLYKSKAYRMAFSDGSKRYKSPNGTKEDVTTNPRWSHSSPLFSEPVVIEFGVDKDAVIDDTSFLVQVRNGVDSDWQTVHDRNTMADILNAYNDSCKSKDNKRIVVRRTQFQPVQNYSPQDEQKRQQALEKLTEEERQLLDL